MTDEGQPAAQELADVIAGVLSIDPADICDASGPDTLGEWTSRKHIELVVAIESVYRVALTAREILAIRSVGDLRRTLSSKGSLP